LKSFVGVLRLLCSSHYGGAAVDESGTVVGHSAPLRYLIFGSCRDSESRLFLFVCVDVETASDALRTLRVFFSSIAQGKVPVLVHCAAGKDRTGLAIELLLVVLDVPYETIIEDYLLTNTCEILEFTLRQHQEQHDVSSSDHPLLTMPEDIRRVLFAAHGEYLSAAFDQITRDRGDVLEFLRSEVGVDDVMRAKVQAALLSAG
jgi:protein tyrosine/serine phosphatase